MKLPSLSKLTRTYVLALSLIAFLTIASIIALHQLILTQSDSARLINVSGSQRWLSQKAALLSTQLVYASTTGERDQFRRQLQSTLGKIQENHQELVSGAPQSNLPIQLSRQMQAMYFSPPTNLQVRIERYTSEALDLANEPVDLLTPDNPHLTYLLQNTEALLESLNRIVSQYQRESEARVQRLQMLETASGGIIILTLTFLGLYTFRPLANTLLEERAQLERANQELSYLSSIDGLTGIANRRYFDQFLAQLWSLAARNSEPIALIMCDIDFFKAYNDTYGHLQGDECLKKVAAAIKRSLQRQVDLAARYGGEEFVVVLPNTDVKGALIVAESLRANVESLEIPHHSSSVTQKVTISLGVAIGLANPTVLPSTLIESADIALYEAKQNGRNCHKLASSSS
ncbi:diguanylate cyclase [Desulfosporosinus sp. Sb-LF]|uniref:GGDEF domain-containing protein n=1 Tax=Desulfosporosinus sp. Sb-LF TaxID=2560027 RepID=UPI00107F65E5|nr:diguanylate cyclase [Desulfosporosinus sp. Sb-LF]TGE33751.1 diguanylate cyclase [Desulfosporosinus sp. Sb-LF]